MNSSNNGTPRAPAGGHPSTPSKTRRDILARAGYGSPGFASPPLQRRSLQGQGTVTLSDSFQRTHLRDVAKQHLDNLWREKLQQSASSSDQKTLKGDFYKEIIGRPSMEFLKYVVYNKELNCKFIVLFDNSKRHDLDGYEICKSLDQADALDFVVEFDWVPEPIKCFITVRGKLFFCLNDQKCRHHTIKVFAALIVMNKVEWQIDDPNWKKAPADAMNDAWQELMERFVTDHVSDQLQMTEFLKEEAIVGKMNTVIGEFEACLGLDEFYEDNDMPIDYEQYQLDEFKKDYFAMSDAIVNRINVSQEPSHCPKDKIISILEKNNDERNANEGARLAYKTQKLEAEAEDKKAMRANEAATIQNEAATIKSNDDDKKARNEQMSRLIEYITTPRKRAREEESLNEATNVAAFIPTNQAPCPANQVSNPAAVMPTNQAMANVPPTNQASDAAAGVPTNQASNAAFAMPTNQATSDNRFNFPPTNQASNAAFTVPTNQATSGNRFNFPATNQASHAAFAMPTNQAPSGNGFNFPATNQASNAAFAMPTNQASDAAAGVPTNQASNVAFAMPSNQATGTSGNCFNFPPTNQAPNAAFAMPTNQGNPFSALGSSTASQAAPSPARLSSAANTNSIANGAAPTSKRRRTQS